MTELSHGNEPQQAALIQDEILEILKEAKVLARRFYRLTGKPLGVTGEVAEYEAATRLGLLLHPARQAGYDATDTLEDGIARIQIKGRCMLNPLKITGRMGAIDLTTADDLFADAERQGMAPTRTMRFDLILTPAQLSQSRHAEASTL
ncbi:hypothetical protein [Pseudomonas sp. MF6747]|uniref:hypothetical protein n=1 Tax=Pseudomonas sp. MF6747 TaxID=2797527 RepID=UPI001F24EAAB|nr:hypothetical protein [Pseudomonas sp. MF6747]